MVASAERTSQTVGAAETMYELFTRVPDHRRGQGRRYPMPGMLGIALGAVMAGRQSLAAIARWGRRLSREQLRRFGIDRDRAPCHTSWHYFFRGLDVDALERVLSGWAQLVVGEAPHVRIDGKTLRGSRHGEYSAVHLLAAYCDEAQVVLAQERVADDENEVGAALRVLNRLPLAGAVVTGDALFTQRSVCTLIGKKGATTSWS